jgi:3-oxoacyl-[acyl-carrier protein] reductase
VTSLAATTRILVTGGGRGLGRAIALALAAPGRRIAILGRNRDGLDQTAQALLASGAEPMLILGDLTSGDDRAAAVRGIDAAWGGLDILVNNAGAGAYKPFLAHASAEIEAIIAVNLTGLIQLTHALLPSIERGEGGHIVNIASDVGRRPIANMAPYVAAKHGVVGFSHALRLELRPSGIKVGVILPGLIDTGFNDSVEGSKPGVLRPADVAAAVVAMLSQPAGAQIDELTVHPMSQDA